MPNMPSRRQIKVAEFIRIEMAKILETFSFHDADLVDKKFTLTQADISPDLKNVRIYTLPFGLTEQEEIKKQLAKLNAQVPLLRKVLAKSGLRFLPKILFVYDDQFDRQQYMDSLFQKITPQEPPHDAS